PAALPQVRERRTRVAEPDEPAIGDEPVLHPGLVEPARGVPSKPQRPPSEARRQTAPPEGGPPAHVAVGVADQRGSGRRASVLARGPRGRKSASRWHTGCSALASYARRDRTLAEAEPIDHRVRSRVTRRLRDRQPRPDGALHRPGERQPA